MVAGGKRAVILMGENSKIEWCDHTHNLWWGCVEVGGDPACDGCYARDRAENPYWWGKTPIFPVWGQDAGRRFFSDQHYLEPLKWNRSAAKAGVPAFVFCMSMGDWAEGRMDQRNTLERRLFPMVEQTPWLMWLLLTKRPQIAAKIVPEHWQRNGWPENAWPGVTAVTQKWWDIRLPSLMDIPAKRHFVSAEPLMEQIDMGPHRPEWLICGGESGKEARPMHPDWARSLRDQCQAAGVAFHFKQWGEWKQLDEDFEYYKYGRRVRNNSDFVRQLSRYQKNNNARELLCPGLLLEYKQSGCISYGDRAIARVGKKLAGRLLDGREWNEFPEVK